jgi:hypothetical protein
MADETIGIISALNEAGLLGTARQHQPRLES